MATTPDSEWYQQLDKPSWQPPPIAFPLVWTPLYADIESVLAQPNTPLPAPVAAAMRQLLNVRLDVRADASIR